MLEISFPNKDDPAAAGKLARTLRTSLLQAGIPDSQLSVVRERDDAQDVGTLLQLEWASLLHGAHLTLTTIAVAKALWEICTPARAAVRIKRGGHTIELNASEIQADKLEQILTELAKDEREK
jgi:hypothetical protein